MQLKVIPKRYKSGIKRSCIYIQLNISQTKRKLYTCFIAKGTLIANQVNKNAMIFLLMCVISLTNLHHLRAYRNIFPALIINCYFLSVLLFVLDKTGFFCPLLFILVSFWPHSIIIAWYGSMMPRVIRIVRVI